MRESPEFEVIAGAPHPQLPQIRSTFFSCLSSYAWKQMNREIQLDRGLSRWKDLSVSAVVILTVFNEMVFEATGQVEENNCSSASIPSPIMVKEWAI